MQNKKSGEESGKKDPKEVRCGECGTRFKGSDKAKCPRCGSTKKADGPINSVRKVEANIVVKARVSGVHEAHMSPQSWTIFGLMLGFVIPPIFYAVFSILTIGFWYKLLIWLGIILTAFYLTRSYTIIRLLRFIADKAYGKRKI